MMTAGYTALAIAAGVGVGTPFSGELNQQPGSTKSKLFSRVTSRPSAFCFARHQFVRQKKCFSLPNNNSNLKRSFALRKDADDNFLKNAEDVDEVFDDLFNKYGKVVFRRNEQRPSIAEVDDDAETLSCDVVVHIFLPEQRDYYNLEEFYGNAKSIDLPFENQPPPFRG
ncbi:unnamed protein product [Linum tenue]|uniref:Uncharacterized protein n=1 Tax=Linum tenue TaxID=586396 RepID=A0AAV0MUC3_9ROSI|nr:unnamed protein product [Linum tenue]